MNLTGNVLNNRWTVGTLIGSGGAGAVYLVTDSTNNEEEAVVKFGVACNLEVDSDDEYDAQEDAKDDLDNERKILLDLKSRAPTLSVPEVIESGIHEGIPFLIMTKFGESLDDLHEKSDSPFFNKEILVVIKQIFNIMRALHGLNVSHGDIKESNIVRGLGEQKDNFFLIDFGQSSKRAFDPSNDVGDWFQLMVRLYRNSEEGLVPTDQIGEYNWNGLSKKQYRTVLNNFQKAVDARNAIGAPIPSEIQALFHESLGQSPPDYERMSLRLQQAIARTDPSEKVFV